MQKGKLKIVQVELNELLSSHFESIKVYLGIQNDAEVIRFLIQNYYSEYLRKNKSEVLRELGTDKTIVNKFMEKYGEEWKKLSED